MQLRVFTAPELHEALAQVRTVLGPDALVLDRQTEKAADGSKQWKVYAAMDRAEAAAPVAAVDETPAMSQTVSRLERLVEGLAKHESASLRSSLGSLAEQQAFDTLIGFGVAPNYALDMAAPFLESKLPDVSMLRWGERVQPAEKQEVLTFFGPAGAGKTLMIARLATHFSLQGISVTLLSLDTERIAANAQLAAYAEILGVPLLTAHDGCEAREMMVQHDSARLLLVDSEGWQRQHPKTLTKLAEDMSHISATRRLLVLPANMDEQDSVRVMREAACLSPTDLVFSKLDETARPGKVINLAAASRLPLSYCSFGPDVPDHLGWLSPESLVSMMTGQT